MILGAHVSIAGGIQNAPLNGRKIGCDAIQIFAKNQTQWQAKPYTDENIEGFKENLKTTGINPVIIHDSYLINLCTSDKVKLEKSINAYLDELKRAQTLKVPYLVMHPGSHLQNGEEWGLVKIAESLNYIHERTPDYQVITLLETTAGQGTNLGYRFEHLASIREMVVQKDRIGVCADTCHMFAAGYDLKTDQGYSDTWNRFDDIVGIENLKCFHLNDSKKPLSSRVDRHEHIGQGHLGIEPFKKLMADPRFEDLPGLLETPGDEEDFIRNLKLLRSL
ncbi:deoxyribonuclease IV [candidate division LCP-89 bacterium B3_LCP]|uniref:Probable endonuclease 4 n=1 Tax=candidate division LCP-89 bacterium B3_LCP TaxID=2012998 RepID=A0A532V5C7_UNCL8|nr:MAG: deoxyribonuclease IV [candidate division LCP-89 bacterium B3_LCP]